MNNHSSWQRAVYEGPPCPMDTFLVFPQVAGNVQPFQT